MAKRTRLCDWSIGEIERLREFLKNHRQLWPELAKKACVDVRYIRALVDGTINVPTADRYLALERASRTLRFQQAIDRVRRRASSRGRAASPRRRKPT